MTTKTALGHLGLVNTNSSLLHRPIGWVGITLIYRTLF